MSGAPTRRGLLAGSAAAALGLAAGVAPASASASTPAVASNVSAEAVALQGELARLSSAYHRASREADETSEATADVEPPEALYARPKDSWLLNCRAPAKSWTDGRCWWGEDDLIEALRTDTFRFYNGEDDQVSVARRDEIVGAWDAWQAAEKTARDVSGYTVAEERLDQADAAYREFRTRLVELRTDDPEILTVKALCIADLCGRDAGRLGYWIERALKRNSGAYEDALALSLARDFLGLMGTGVMS